MLMQNLFIVHSLHAMMEMVTISREEYELLKKKAELADDAMTQLRLSLDDLEHGRIHRVA